MRGTGIILFNTCICIATITAILGGSCSDKIMPWMRAVDWTPPLGDRLATRIRLPNRVTTTSTTQ